MNLFLWVVWARETAKQAETTIFESLKHLPNFPCGKNLPAQYEESSDGTLLYQSGAVRKSGPEQDGAAVKRRKYDPNQWKVMRDEFCRRWQLRRF